MSEPSDRPPRRGRHGQDVAVDEDHADDDRTDAPITGELRIDAPAASVAAGLTAPEAEVAPPPPVAEAPGTEGFELPNWADPPTGQVPRVLLERSELEGTEGVEALRGPTWRQEAEEFNDPDDLSLLLADDGPDEAIAGAVEREAPFEFAFELDEEGAVAPDAALEENEDETPWTPLFSAEEPMRRRRRAVRRPPAHVHHAPPRATRNLALATLTGLVLAGIAVACLATSAAATVALGALATTVAAGEVFAVAQRSGMRPATLPGLLAVPALALGAYWHGPSGALAVAAAAFVLLGGWQLLPASGRDTVANFGLSTLVVAWCGLAGVGAALLLRPSAHPHHHGQAIVAALVVLVVVNDVAAYLVGSRFGRHRLAPAISPGKSVEGLLGGTVLCLAVAALGLAHLHPLGLGSALGLGVLVAVVAPIGDLVESRVKRDLGVKDMGTMLPAHGGLFDRVDALLFALPATYLLVSAIGLR